MEPLAPGAVAVSSEEIFDLCSRDLILYGRTWFPKTFRQESPDFHHDVGDAFLGRDRYLSLEVFRDGAKTTLTRVALTHRLAYGVSRAMVIVSAKEGHAVLTVRWIKRQVEHNTRWANYYRIRKGTKWSDNHIEVYLESLDEYVNIVALGITGQLRGFNFDDYRPDFIMCDDTSTDEVAESAAQTAKQEDTVFGALVNSLAPETESPFAKMVVIDTPKVDGDLVSVCKKDPQFHSLSFGIFDEEGKSRWEARYPTAQLLRDKANAIRMGRLVRWLKEKECKITSGELVSFNKDFVKYWTAPLPTQLARVIVIDPATDSTDPKADQTAVGVLGFRKEDIYLLDVKAARGQDPEMIWTTVVEYARRWNTRQVVVETVAYQRILAWYLERNMSRDRFFMTVHKLIDKRQKPDRIMQALGDATAYGQFYCREEHTEFLEQFSLFYPGYKGLVDILDMVALGITWADGVGFNEWYEDDPSALSSEDDEYDREGYKRLSLTGAP